MAYAIAYYSKLSYVINIPLTDSQDYDFIIDTGTDLLKVQVYSTDPTISVKNCDVRFWIGSTVKDGTTDSNGVASFTGLTTGTTGAVTVGTTGGLPAGGTPGGNVLSIVFSLAI